MSEDLDPKEEHFDPEMKPEQVHEEGTRITRVSGMYEDYFLDYASYVILERAVPALNDGLKPVQRRLLHAMKEMDDGRFIRWRTSSDRPCAFTRMVMHQLEMLWSRWVKKIYSLIARGTGEIFSPETVRQRRVTSKRV
jgi:hypothetical protein